jgi:hypothetical protein
VVTLLLPFVAVGAYVLGQPATQVGALTTATVHTLSDAKVERDPDASLRRGVIQAPGACILTPA